MEGHESTPLLSSGYGVLRGVGVHTLIYPLEVLKVRHQCSEKKLHETAVKVISEEGIGAFYKGLSSQLMKTCLKQVWAWPVITEVPKFFDRQGVGKNEQQALTGISIAAFDTLVSTPLEKAKIRSASSGKSVTFFKALQERGWQGGGTLFSKLSVQWVTFLTAQRILREKFREGEKPLNTSQQMLVGTILAIIGSIAAAPFDMANTQKLANGKSFFKIAPSKMFRGSGIQTTSLLIHNIASVAVIEKLQKS